MMAKSGYEKCAHLYDLFDSKENIEFLLGYASEAGEETAPSPLSSPTRGEEETISLSSVLSVEGRGKPN